jgi:hypothetical protein
MCWTGKLEDKRVADKSITVYKILAKRHNNTYVAPYMETIYEVGEMYTISSLNPLKTAFGCSYIINKGFHSFDKNCTVCYLPNYSTSVFGADGFFNCYITCWHAGDIAVIAKCTIPKGATYYRNYRGEIVSDTLIIDEIYDVPRQPKHFYDIK